jgi:hypothetical protein
MLIAFTILAMACVANADIYLTIGGLEAPNEITLEPSQWIEIDADLRAGENCFGYTLDFVLENANAHFDSNGIAFPTVFDMAGAATIQQPQYIRTTASQLFNPAKEGPAVLINGIMLHCDVIGDVLLELVAGPGTTIDGVTVADGTVLDELLIHQIPEPMTIALLGLGGLLLRRRK